MLCTAIRDASHVRSIHDIPYQLPANSCYHPSMDVAALRRIRDQIDTYAAFQSTQEKNKFLYILAHVFTNPASRRVWAIVFERNDDAYFVLRNTAQTTTTARYRRVLHVKLDELMKNLAVVETDASADAVMSESDETPKSTHWWLLYLMLAGVVLGASYTFSKLVKDGVRRLDV